ALKNLACAAAFEDPRFPEVEENELININIEISIFILTIQTPAVIHII
ncbi:MAG: AMMECR1 domain-containing protein, partial [Proteobacteria bacterium]|nr:AMMECR1 domain-containing protein [Pseudomonadota bacterium]